MPGKRTLWTYRILGLVIALLIATIPYLIPSETAIDPLWQRFLLAGIITAISIGNIFIPFLQRNTYFFVYGYCFLVNAWLIELAYLNNFSLDYAPTVFVMLVATSLVYKHFRLLVFNLGLLFIISGCLYNIPPAPLVDPFFFMMIELIFILGIGILMDRQINERASLRQDADRLRVITLAAFESSDDGLLVTDMSEEILQFNDRFRSIWGLEDADLHKEAPVLWTEKVLLHLPLNQTSLRRFLEPAVSENEQFSKILRLKDGRVIEFIVRPLAYQNDQLGRIWVFKNISKAEKEKDQLAKQRNVLALENRALSELAANTGTYGADLNKMLLDIGNSSLEVLNASRACIWLADEAESDTMHCRMRLGETSPLPESTFPIEPGVHPVFFTALRKVRVWVIENAAASQATNSLEMVEPGLAEWASLIVPLRYAGKLIGFIALQEKRAVRVWTQGEISFASSLGDIGGIVLEATGRKTAEQKLEEKLALLKSVFEISEIGIVVSSQANKIMDYNASFLDIWGVSPEILRPGNERAVLKQMKAMLRDQKDGEEAYHFLLANPKESRFEIYEFADGRIIECTTQVMLIGDEMVGRTWFYRDITQRKHDEEALKVSERQNRAIVDAVPDLMLRMDRVARHLQVEETNPMFADRFHLNVVLSNLMSNAIKYQDYEKDKPSLHVSITVGEDEAILKVRDNGIGIPKEHQDKLFQLFFRASNQSFGSGLGLYITKNAIEKIDGSIEIESEEGIGTTFRIRIPNKVLSIQ